jgi:hypothetical protein
MNRFENIDRAALQQASKESREKKQSYARDNLKIDWADSNHWRDLATKHGVRLPVWYIPNTETKYLRRLFKHKDVDIKHYLEYCGCKSMKQLVDMNPEYPAFVEVGFALEWLDEKAGGD